MQINNINNHKQSFGINQAIIETNIRDFAPRERKLIEAVIPKLEKAGTGDNFIYFDMVIPVNDFTVSAKKQPKTFVQKVLFALGCSKKTEVILEKISGEEELIKAGKQVLKELT